MASAIKHKRQVVLKQYESAHSNEAHDRLVEPIEFTSNMIDIWAYDVDKAEPRMFKVARIHTVEETDTPWEFASQHNVPRPDVFRMTGTLNEKIALQLNTRAAEMLGAAHQRPQRFSVMTTFPQLHVQKETSLDWNHRASINRALLQTRNSETGSVCFSCPELTALDLVQYEQHIGGLSRAATVIEELSEQTDWKGAAENGLFAQTTIATIQRLGYILEEVLLNQEQADALFTELHLLSPKLNRFPLFSRKSAEGSEVNKRWNILINTEIEIDEL